MKKIIILFLLLIPSYAFALGACISGLAGGTASVSCDTQASPTDMVAQTAAYELFKNTGLDWWSTAFISDGSTICKIEVYFDTSTGTDPSFETIAVYVYSDDGTTNCNSAGCPSSLLATFTTISKTGLGSAGWKTSTGTFVGSNATTYHVVLASSGIDDTNVPRWYRDNTCTTENISYSPDGSTWTGSSSSNCQNVRFYKQ